MTERDQRPPLPDEQFRVIGQVTVQWALLAALIDLLVYGRGHNPDPTPERVPSTLAFAQRLRLWEALTTQRLSGSELEGMRALIRQAESIFISHETILRHQRFDLRYWVDQQIDSGSDKRPEAARYISADGVEALERVADEIATINKELLGFCRRLGDKLVPTA